MRDIRKSLGLDALILGSIFVTAIALSALMTFPSSPVVWQLLSWIVVVALLVLLLAVSATAYALAFHRTSRSWKRIACFLLGASCLAVIAIQSR